MKKCSQSSQLTDALVVFGVVAALRYTRHDSLMLITFLERVIYSFLRFGDAPVDDDSGNSINFNQACHTDSHLIEVALFDFLLSRWSSDASLGLRRLDDIRRRKFLKLVVLPALAIDVPDLRSTSVGLVLAV